MHQLEESHKLNVEWKKKAAEEHKQSKIYIKFKCKPNKYISHKYLFGKVIFFLNQENDKNKIRIVVTPWMEGIQFKKGTRWDLTVLVMFYFLKLCGEYSSVNVIIIL